MSDERSSDRMLKRPSLVSGPSPKEDIDGYDIHFFCRFHILNFQSDGSKALQVDATQPVMLSSEHAIHGAENAVETMKICEGAIRNLQLVIDFVDSELSQVCASLLSLINGTTLVL